MDKLNIGQTLREARSARGYILDEVAKATRIKISYLQAIEENQFQILPALAYLKGYIRKYCEFLGIDSTPLLNSLDEESIPSYRLELSIPPRGDFYRKKNPLRIALISVASAVLLFLFVLLIINLVVPPLNSPSPEGNVSSPTTPLSESPSSLASSTPSENQALTPSTNSPTSIASLPETELQIIALEDGELTLSINGQEQFAGRLFSGQKGTWRGQSFQIIFDDPAKFKILIDSQEVTPFSATFFYPTP